MERAILGGAVTDFLPIQWKDAPGVGLPLASPDMLYKERTPKMNLRGSQSGGHLLSHNAVQYRGYRCVLPETGFWYLYEDRVAVFSSLLDADAGCVVPIVSVTDEELSVHEHFLCVIGAEEEFFNPFGYRFEVVSLAVEEGHSVEVVFS